jgi:hypothetical protein
VIGEWYALDGGNIVGDIGGNLTFDAIVAEPQAGIGGGLIDLTVDGSEGIRMNTGGLGMAADRIELVANNGSIDTAIAANSVSAIAPRGDVNLNIRPGVIDGNTTTSGGSQTGTQTSGTTGSNTSGTSSSTSTGGQSGSSTGLIGSSSQNERVFGIPQGGSGSSSSSGGQSSGDHTSGSSQTSSGTSSQVFGNVGGQSSSSSGTSGSTSNTTGTSGTNSTTGTSTTGTSTTGLQQVFPQQ